MPSEITHKTGFSPGKYLGVLLLALLFGWLMGINGVGLDADAASPMDQARVPAPCSAATP